MLLLLPLPEAGVLFLALAPGIFISEMSMMKYCLLEKKQITDTVYSVVLLTELPKITSR